MLPLRLFVSYSHADESFKDEFISHLSPLINDNLIEVWHDRLLKPGELLDERLKAELETSDMVAFLISADFLSSISCYEQELMNAIRQREKNNIVILPIVLRNCNWLQTPLAKFVATTPDGKPIVDYPTQDDGWTTVVKNIRSICVTYSTEDNVLTVTSDQTKSNDGIIRPSFQKWLRDTQLPIEHSHKEHVELEDLFVYPEAQFQIRVELTH